MFATPIRLAQGGAGMPGFWKRSLDEFKRQANIAVKMEGLHRPQKPRPLVQFTDSGSLGLCKLMSDKDIGGYSEASMSFVDGAAHEDSNREQGVIGNEKQGGGEEEEPARMLFKGKISTELPPNNPDVQRTGDRGLSLFGRLLWDIDPYNYLALRVKSDGRKYFVNIQTESIVPTDLHQHLLPTYTPGQWETVIIPFHAFVRTNYGMVVEPQREMLRQKVKSVGIGLTDRVPGPFELCIADVYATNKAPSRDVAREESGFDMEPESQGIMDEIEPRKKKGEQEKILI
ncbi:uncharacterized protein LTR77_010703 [Saxophila tyrrhenica]|uniref:NADH:ubiquinone oxidoreductase intermediate-associated protein 30 domain-containing protein n=1 Tax=Saxophila tyrrhenica TaxID=1690608 RepID=A0AAV9NVE5_9PEZI|nr:hypothetical protein LTR77_010703 [Saxophila tyrrhenica]